MSSIDQVQDAIAAINARAAERFAEAATDIAGKMPVSDEATWAETVLEIAGSGWHAWETANAFCDISAALLAARDQRALLQCGRYGAGLCGFSFEPSATYFRGIGELLDAGLVDRAPAIEAAGETIRARFPHASSLITDYLRTAFGLAVTSDMGHLTDWTEVAGDIAELTRDELIRFFAASRSAGDIDWQFIRSLSGVSLPGSLEYMRVHQALARSLGEGETALRGHMLKYAVDEEQFGPFLDHLCAVLPGLPPGERRQLISLFDQLAGIDLAESLLSAVDTLPLDRPGVLTEWIGGVHAFLPLNVAAARGFLAMESATSVDLMQRLLGQVNLGDCQRVLQLYSEAIIGQHLLIQAHSEDVEIFRDLPTTDGLSVYLPESVSRFGSVEENFAFFKMSLVHQLGYYEFGTFTFSHGNSFVAFGDAFHRFAEPSLARTIFQIVEDARVDWAIERRYRGAAVELARFKADALASMASTPDGSPRATCLAALLAFSLDAEAFSVPGLLAADVSALQQAIAELKEADADVYRSMDAMARCYEIIAGQTIEATIPDEAQADPAEVQPRQEPVEVAFRGRLEPDRVRINLNLADLEEQEIDFDEDGEDTMTLSFPVNPKNVTIEQLKRGDVQDALGQMITELEGRPAESDELTDEQKQALEAFRGLLAAQSTPTPEAAYRYDEWDCVIEDYRRRWCTLYEIRNLEEHPEFVEATLKELPGVARRVRRQLNNLKPELLRKVRGVIDGEELDLERAVELVVDKRAGLSPEERIYVERVRKDRDVSALFLLDMSASTDDRIPEPEAPARTSPEWDKDDFLHDYYGAKSEADQRKRIIDLEKEAVVLMAEALQDLGDNYSVCGFSGYGKDQVDFYLCKDFMEPYNLRAKGRIGGMKPCRSTRMGPAIRHATKRLVATESRIKAMIIISDGYPQDFDYGKDRNSKDYGIRDTTKALSEARQKGVQTFCLTVDPSGHDYLREMCPDQQYMVIQDINQLPDELSKVYRSLTG